jgi:hypothetical protein
MISFDQFEKDLKDQQAKIKAAGRIELKAIKEFASRSEETYCYDAALYFDGKKIGKVGNAGHGGCDDHHIIDQAGWDKMLESIDVIDDSKYTALEIFCHDSVSDYISRKEFKRQINKNAVYLKDGKLMIMGYKKGKPDQRLFDHVKKECNTSVILNTLPEDEALKIWNEHMGA